MSLLHLVRVDIPPDLEEAFDAWYENVHVPSLLRCPGWLSARRFIATDGGPKFIAVYELAGAWAYQTDAYARTKGFDEFEPHVRNLTRVQGRLRSWRVGESRPEVDGPREAARS